MKTDLAVLPFVRSSRHLRETVSTNDLAKADAPTALARDLPRLYRADRQTNGRGRGSNAWWSDEGSLLCSILLDPAAHGLRAEHEPRVALAAGLAVLEAAEPWIGLASIGIRWPNDVEIDGRKVAGILVERLSTPAGVRLVIGIGLNVATRFDDAPSDVRGLATALWHYAPSLARPDAGSVVLVELLHRLDRQIRRLAADDPAQVDDLNRFDLLAGRAVWIDFGEGRLEGHGRGIAADGALRLEVGGVIQPVYGGRVER